MRSPAEKTGEDDKACCHVPPKRKERMLYMCRQAAKPPFCCAEKCAADVKRSINTICEKGGLKRAVQTKLPACDKRRLKRAIQWINRNCDVHRKFRKNI